MSMVITGAVPESIFWTNESNTTTALGVTTLDFFNSYGDIWNPSHSSREKSILILIIGRTWHRKYNYFMCYLFKDIPRQSNNFDCGVFCCATIDRLLSGKEARYTQTDMPALRGKESIHSYWLLEKICCEIAKGQLITWTCLNYSTFNKQFWLI